MQEYSGTKVIYFNGSLRLWIISLLMIRKSSGLPSDEVSN